ncbi:hypothetical protein ACQ4LE_001054 [Meloidogyne hapla]
MDLLRTFPPDVNFLEDAQPTEKAKDLGFPRNFPHKLVCLRQELVDTFVDAKMYEQRKTATSTENQLKENDQNKTEEEAKDVADQFNLLLQPKMRQNCLFEGRCRLVFIFKFCPVFIRWCKVKEVPSCISLEVHVGGRV